MSWLSRVIHLITLSVIFVAMLLSRRYFSFLLKVSASVCLLQCLCLYCLSELVFFESLFFINRINQVVLNAAPRNGRIADVTCRRWTAFAF